MPDTFTPPVWPVCGRCGRAYVLRMVVSLDLAKPMQEWLWKRDCWHLRRDPGPFLTGPGSATSTGWLFHEGRLTSVG